MFALSQIIVVSANKTGSGEELTPWVRLLSRNAFGNYRTLVARRDTQPHDGQVSRSRLQPQGVEHQFAERELPARADAAVHDRAVGAESGRDAEAGCEGQPIPTYTQNHIKDFARALTGWTFPTRPGRRRSNSNPQYFVGNMEPRTTTHDTGAKTCCRGRDVAGRSVDDAGHGVRCSTTSSASQRAAVCRDAIDSLARHEQSQPGATSSASRTCSPTTAQGVRGDLQRVLTAILTDPEAQLRGRRRPIEGSGAAHDWSRAGAGRADQRPERVQLCLQQPDAVAC